MNRRKTFIWLLAWGLPITTAVSLLAEGPATTQSVPRDDAMNWLLNSAQPTTKPQPAEMLLEKPTSNPFQEHEDLGYRPATVTTSDGEKFHGHLATTLDKPIRVWDDAKKDYRDVPYKLVKRMEARVVWERDEKEWHFRESGSDIKEYTGKTYPARELEYTVTLVNGQSVTGAVDAPLYLDQSKGGDKVLIIHKRDKGEVGQPLKDLIYIKTVEFD